MSNPVSKQPCALGPSNVCQNQNNNRTHLPDGAFNNACHSSLGLNPMPTVWETADDITSLPNDIKNLPPSGPFSVHRNAPPHVPTTPMLAQIAPPGFPRAATMMPQFSSTQALARPTNGQVSSDLESFFSTPIRAMCPMTLMMPTMMPMIPPIGALPPKPTADSPTLRHQNGLCPSNFVHWQSSFMAPVALADNIHGNPSTAPASFSEHPVMFGHLPVPGAVFLPLQTSFWLSGRAAECSDTSPEYIHNKEVLTARCLHENLKRFGRQYNNNWNARNRVLKAKALEVSRCKKQRLAKVAEMHPPVFLHAPKFDLPRDHIQESGTLFPSFAACPLHVPTSLLECSGKKKRKRGSKGSIAAFKAFDPHSCGIDLSKIPEGMWVCTKCTGFNDKADVPSSIAALCKLWQRSASKNLCIQGSNCALGTQATDSRRKQHNECQQRSCALVWLRQSRRRRPR